MTLYPCMVFKVVNKKDSMAPEAYADLKRRYPSLSDDTTVGVGAMHLDYCEIHALKMKEQRALKNVKEWVRRRARGFHGEIRVYKWNGGNPKGWGGNKNGRLGADGLICSLQV